MPASGGSVTDNSVPTNKVVKGQKHYLAYITPDEGKSLVDQGGTEVITKEGIPAYPGHYGGGSSSSGGGSPHGNGGGSSGPSGPPGGGATSQGSGRDYSPPSAPTADRHPDPSPVVTTAKAPPSVLSRPVQDLDEQMVSDPGYIEYKPRVNIEDIHGEFDDPDSVSYDPTYDPAKQAEATKASAFGTDKHAGEYKWNPKTGEYERFTDYTFAEHWDRAPDSIKFSPTLRLLWATGANLGEWSKRQGANVWDWGTGESNISPAPDRGDGPGATGTVSAAQSNFITSGQITPSNSVAANWYQSLGSSSASGNASAFNLASEYAAAKTKVKQTLGTPSAVGMLAVNDSPFFDFLQKHNLTKGIL